MPYVPKGDRPENRDSKTNIARVIVDLGARCPKCKSIETIEADKEGTKRICMKCQHQYDV